MNEIEMLILLSPMIVLSVALNLVVTEGLRFLWKLGQRAVQRITVLISTV